MKSGTGKYHFITLLTLLCFLVVSSATAQQNGVVEGRIVNGTDPAMVAGGVPLEVVALSGGMRIIRTAAADSKGEFRIDGLPVDAMLMVRAVYQNANYHTQVNFDAYGKAVVEIEIFDATTSMQDIRVEEYQMVFQATGNHLQSLDTVTIYNATAPEKTLMNPEGNFRFSKAPAIMSIPQMRITAPGTSMPVVQSALESPDGQSYYSLYPLRPGRTAIDVFQILPYETLAYTYTKKFYYPVSSIEIGVIPMDMELSGTGLTRVRTDPDKNIAVYRIGPLDEGTEVRWSFSGGTPVSEQAQPAASESSIRPVSNAVGRNALVIGPVLLIGFILVLWYAFHRTGGSIASGIDAQRKLMIERREELLHQMADLDRRYEAHAMDQHEYLRLREEGKHKLRRIALLLKEN